MSHEKRERERKEKNTTRASETVIFDDFLKKSSLSNSTKPHKMAVSGAGSTSPMGIPVASLTPNKKFLLVEFL